MGRGRLVRFVAISSFLAGVVADVIGLPISYSKDFMKRFQRRLPYQGAIAAAAVSSVLVSLAGCSGLSDTLAGDKVDYSHATSAPTLQVPKDLSAPKIDQAYVAPPIAAVGTGPQMSVTPSGGKTIGVPSANDPYGMHIAEDRTQRWLVVDGRTPEQLWPLLKDFWQENGFVLSTDAPMTGVMETDWAENTAQLPNDWFRRLLGKFATHIYSTGTRDRFRTQVQHAADGSTAIYITQSGMVEKSVGREGETTRWVDRPRDPNLELAFMARLVEKFGLTDAQAKQLIAQAHPVVARVVSIDTSTGQPVIVVNEALDRTWLRVGLALDRSDFLVDDSNRETGVFTVHYTDPVKDNERHSGLFGKLFGKGKPAKALPLLVKLQSGADGSTRIGVENAQGQPDDSKEAQHLVAVLKQQLS